MKSGTARLVEARDALARGRNLLTAALERAHPRPGCLPVPDIQAPGSRSGVDEASEAILQNLFAARGHRAPEWIAARASCTHLPAEQIDRIHYLLYRWYQVLLSAGRHVDDGNKKSPYNLEWCEQRLIEQIESVDAERRGTR